VSAMSSSGFPGIRSRHVEIHLPGVAPGTAPSRSGPVGGCAGVAGGGAGAGRSGRPDAFALAVFGLPPLALAPLPLRPVVLPAPDGLARFASFPAMRSTVAARRAGSPSGTPLAR